MNEHRPCIGVFDSGVGGLSVWRAIERLLPEVPTIYLADQAYCPYGDKSPERIAERSLAIARYLYGQGCRLLVVACNTATAAAIGTLRHIWGGRMPIVGMEPALKPAVLQTQTGHIGLLATAGTLNGRLFRETKARFAEHVTVHSCIGHGLVECVEAGHIQTPQTMALLAQYLAPMLSDRIDHLVLGCTHYPFLIPALEELLPAGVVVVEPAEAVARQVARRWRYAIAPQEVTQHRFGSTGQTDALARMLRTLGRKEIPTRVSLTRDGSAR